jgi:GT2 family glycosyltransferase
MTERVYIIVVNYRGTEDTIECLESLLKSDYPDFQIIVVDNSEKSEFVAKLKNWATGTQTNLQTGFPHLVFPLETKPLSAVFIDENNLSADAVYDQKLIIVKSELNRGFAAANNIALRYINGRNDFIFAWLLNNDTVVEKKALSFMVECAAADTTTGIVGSKLLLYHQPDHLQAVGGSYNPWFGKVKEIGFKEKDVGQWDVRTPVIDYVVGASMLVRKQFIKEVGIMEEDYFLYYEELDWAIRGSRKGWKLGFCPKARVYHKMGASINKENKSGSSRMADFYSVRNRVLITRKYFPLALITLYPSFIKFIINRIRLKQFRRILMMLKILIAPEKQYF